MLLISINCYAKAMYFTQNYLISELGEDIFEEIQKYLSLDADLPIFKAKFLINSVRALASDLSYMTIEHFIPKHTINRPVLITGITEEYKNFYINIFDSAIEDRVSDALIKYYNSMESEELLLNRLPRIPFERQIKLENFLELSSYLNFKRCLDEELPMLDDIETLSLPEEIQHTFRTNITLLEGRKENLSNKIINVNQYLIYSLKSYYTAFDCALDNIAKEKQREKQRELQQQEVLHLQEEKSLCQQELQSIELKMVEGNDRLTLEMEGLDQYLELAEFFSAKNASLATKVINFGFEALKTYVNAMKSLFSNIKHFLPRYYQLENSSEQMLEDKISDNTTGTDETNDKVSSFSSNNCSLKVQVDSINKEATEYASTSSSSLTPFVHHCLSSEECNLHTIHEVEYSKQEEEYSSSSTNIPEASSNILDQVNLGLSYES